LDRTPLFRVFERAWLPWGRRKVVTDSQGTKLFHIAQNCMHFHTAGNVVEPGGRKVMWMRGTWETWKRTLKR
jgi:hypothetical protein